MVATRCCKVLAAASPPAATAAPWLHPAALLGGAAAWGPAWLRAALACPPLQLRRGLAAPSRKGDDDDDDDDGGAAAAGLPPAWQPPPHNPVSLKPRPPPSAAETLRRIQQARTPLELHNAYRRRPADLPPYVAAAKFARLAQLLGPPSPASSPASPPTALPSAPPTSAAPGMRRVVSQVGSSWEAYLHLFSAPQLAACVRAACETGLLLDHPARPQPHGGSAGVGTSGGSALGSSSSTSTSSSASSTDSSGSALGAAAPAAAAAAPAAVAGPGGGAPGADPGGGGGVLARSLAILLDDGGRELGEAGPQAVLDVSYGLMRAGHVLPYTWHTLAPLLREAERQLQVQAGAAAGAEPGAGRLLSPLEEAAAVLAWLRDKGLA